MAKIPKKVRQWRRKQKKGAIMKPSTFAKIERGAARKGARNPKKVAGKAYWRTVLAKARKTLAGQMRKGKKA